VTKKITKKIYKKKINKKFTWSNSLYIKCYAYLITYLAWTILSLQQLWYYFLNCVYPNPPCQLSLWEETGVPGENQRLSAERWLTLFTWARSENRTHVLTGETRLLWRPSYRSPYYKPAVRWICAFKSRSGQLLLLTRKINLASHIYAVAYLSVLHLYSADTMARCE
jgi:hypothetical protein